MGKAKRECQIKENGKYKTSRIDTDENEVNKSLLHDLIAKKFNGCTYITRIVKRNNYDGTITVTVTYDNGARNIYTVEY